MDLVIDYLDEVYLDEWYSQNAPAPFQERDYWVRQFSTIMVLWVIGGWLMYLSCAFASYVLFFDKSLKKHPKYLPNQIAQEIKVAMTSIPIMALPSAFIFLAEVRGYSRLYDSVDAYGGIPFILASIPMYLLFTDTGIYWIHRWLHHPILYAPIHKLHHKWIVSTPFASHAFHPLDGFAQSLPYHIYVFLFPMNKALYMGSFMFVNIWTISIHDNYQYYYGTILNGAEHHTIHHRQFNYNYGQYFTFWDRFCGTHRMPTKKDY